MKYILLCQILLVTISQYLSITKNIDLNQNIILQVNEKYSRQLGDKRINEFKNMIFRELDQKSNVLDSHLNEISSKKNRTNINIFSNTGLKVFGGDYVTTDRIVRLYVSHTQECSILINDTASYDNLNNVNFVEHMILHNNADYIEPKGVYSNNININFFAFNKKLNLFSVYFDANKKSQIKNEIPNNFTIEYEYDALNIIKSNLIKDADLSTMISSGNDTFLFSTNYFIWKILNQNFLKTKENVTIEIYFDLGKEFESEIVEFSLKNFTKSTLNDSKKTIVKYTWNGLIEPQAVIILHAKFPLYFEHCGDISINILMIFIGAIFIIFLIGMLYVILSTVFSEDIY